VEYKMVLKFETDKVKDKKELQERVYELLCWEADLGLYHAYAIKKRKKGVIL